MKEIKKHSSNFEWNIKKKCMFWLRRLTECMREWMTTDEWMWTKKKTRKIDMWQSIKMDLDNDDEIEENEKIPIFSLRNLFPDMKILYEKKIELIKRNWKMSKWFFFFLMCFKFYSVL